MRRILLCYPVMCALGMFYAPIVVRAQTTAPAITPIQEVSNLEHLLTARPVFNVKLTISQAVAIALRESPVVRGAVAEVEGAKGELNLAQAERKPWLSANTFLSGGSIPNIIESPTIVQPSMIMNLPRGAYFDQNLMAMYPLYTSGRLKALVRQAAALRNASQSELETQRQEVALMTRLAYREIVARQSLVEVSRSRLQENEAQLRVDRDRANEGKIPPFYIQRDEAEVAVTQQEQTNALRDVELSLTQLKTVMGINPASHLELVDASAYGPSPQLLHQLTGLPAITFPTPSSASEQAVATGSSTTTQTVVSNSGTGLPPDLAALLRLAERQRPELQALSERVTAAQAATAATRHTYGPQVNAFVMGDIGRPQGAARFAGATFGLVASVPIFNGGQKAARAQISAAQQHRQEQEQEREALQIAQEVTSALLNLRAAEQNIQTTQTASVAARENYRVARLRYEAGKSVVVEDLDALAARVRAESNVVQARYGYNTACDQLLRATGTTDFPLGVGVK